MSTPKRLKVLWLCSWYPSTVEPFAGDFIQRHAEAVSSFVDVHVLHAIGDPNRNQYTHTKVDRDSRLREWIAYYPTRQSFQRWISPITWFITMWRLTQAYQAAYGLPDLIHVQVPYKSGIIARLFLMIYGVIYVTTEHWGIYNENSDTRFSNRSFMFRWLDRWAYNGSSLSLSVSNYQAGQLKKYLSDIPAVTVRNVVNTSLFEPSEGSHDDFTFLHVSDWSENKNPRAIVRAFKELAAERQEIKLVMVGGKGEQLVNIERFVGLDQPSILCMGIVSYAQVADLMNKADCLVLFSSNENSPCVIGEALCCGIQVISSDVGGVSELMDPTCCQLVPAGDEHALLDAMRRSVDLKPNIRRSEVAARAKDMYAYEAVGGKIFDAYLTVIGR